MIIVYNTIVKNKFREILVFVFLQSLSLLGFASSRGECIALAAGHYNLPPSVLLALSSESPARISLPEAWQTLLTSQGINADRTGCANLLITAYILKKEWVKLTLHDSLMTFSPDPGEAGSFAARVLQKMRRIDEFSQRNGAVGLRSALPIVTLPGPDSRRWQQDIQRVADIAGLAPGFIHAVVRAESNYNPKAVSAKGAAGMMQLMPATAKRYSVKDRFNPADNLMGGARYLKDLLILFNNNAELAIAAFNAGENAVIKHGNRIPPYSETQAYVPKVMAYWKAYQMYER